MSKPVKVGYRMVPRTRDRGHRSTNLYNRSIMVHARRYDGNNEKYCFVVAQSGMWRVMVVDAVEDDGRATAFGHSWPRAGEAESFGVELNTIFPLFTLFWVNLPQQPGIINLAKESLHDFVQENLSKFTAVRDVRSSNYMSPWYGPEPEEPGYKPERKNEFASPVGSDESESSDLESNKKSHQQSGDKKRKCNNMHSSKQVETWECVAVHHNK